MKIIPHLMATLLLASSSTVYASEHHEKEEKKQHAQHESGSPDDHQDGHEEEHEESHDEEQHDKDNHGAHKEADRAAENGHEDHGKSEEPELTFSAELLREFGGEIASAQAGGIHQQVSLPGEVRLNEEAVAHITPRFAAKITKVRANIGDNIKAGETLAAAESSETLVRFSLKSLIDGVVIKRHVATGEHLSPDDTAFVVADLSTLWVDIALYPKQIPRVKTGQPVRITTSHGPAPVDARIDYVAPLVDEGTRTGLARIFLTNKNREWKPGMFVEATITVGKFPAAVVVPRSAVIDFENQPTVFVRQGERWQPRAVKLGRNDSDQVEILKGLEAGEKYVSRGGFVLKAELQKSEFESGHNH